MHETDIARGLADAFAQAAILTVPPLESSLRFDAIAGLDSVSRVRLMMSVEDRFGIEITPGENGRLKTIVDLVDLVQAKLGAR